MISDNLLEAFSFFSAVEIIIKTSHTVHEDYIDQHHEDGMDYQAYLQLQSHVRVTHITIECRMLYQKLTIASH
jgi:hypothetical protein